MRFNVSCQVTYAVAKPATLVVNVHALRSGTQQIEHESFAVEPKVPCAEFLNKAGQTRFVRLETGPLPALKLTYHATVATRVRLIPVEKLTAHRAGTVDREVMPFLYPSRYCQSDKLGRLAFSKFGKLKHPFEKVTAITNWIHNNVQYLSGSTNWQTSAFDTVTERVGVCRDFAHLGIALCRALNIPARYFTGYAHRLQPPDFHACFEAHIGGVWLLFDPTKLVPLNGLVRIAHGHDAAETAVATFFGPARSTALTVTCEPAETGFTPLPAAQLRRKGVCLDAS